MKYIFLLSLTVLLFAGCEDDLYLSPISDAGSNDFYQTPEDFIQAISGVYAQLKYYPDRHADLSEVRSDNIYAVGQGGVRDWNAINNFLTTLATTGTIRDAWNISFNGIMRANTVLDKLNAEVVPDEGLRNRIAGEAHFLRALYYFDLVRWFGRVPVFTTFVSPTDALTIPRAPVSEVYDLIISDLEFAEGNLPESYSGADLGRATTYAAKALLAQVYLMRSGPVLHPDGPTLATNEYDKALALLNEIIASNRFEMLDDYASIFSYTNENNKEIVWDIQYIGGGLGAGALYPTNWYDEAFARTMGLFPGGNPGDGPKRISDDLYESYDSNDVRRDVAILAGYTDENGNLTDARFYEKFLDISKAGGDRFDWSINFPVVRYTDVLMMKAEAILQGGGGSQAEVDEIVSAVRERAGLGPVSNVTLDQLLEERRKEFAGESSRWYVLVRTGKVLDVMNDWIAREDESGIINHPIDQTQIIYPIPQDQLDVKQGLYEQNVGYN